jgi:hypothetical protein
VREGNYDLILDCHANLVATAQCRAGLVRFRNCRPLTRREHYQCKIYVILALPISVLFHPYYQRGAATHQILPPLELLHPKAPIVMCTHSFAAGAESIQGHWQYIGSAGGPVGVGTHLRFSVFRVGWAARAFDSSIAPTSLMPFPLHGVRGSGVSRVFM